MVKNKSNKNKYIFYRHKEVLKMKISYLEVDGQEIDIIKPLWKN